MSKSNFCISNTDIFVNESIHLKTSHSYLKYMEEHILIIPFESQTGQKTIPVCIENYRDASGTSEFNKLVLKLF